MHLMPKNYLTIVDIPALPATDLDDSLDDSSVEMDVEAQKQTPGYDSSTNTSAKVNSTITNNNNNTNSNNNNKTSGSTRVVNCNKNVISNSRSIYEPGPAVAQVELGAADDVTKTHHSAGATGADSMPKFKIVLLGEQSVGKTSLVTKFLHGGFDDGYQATIGVDFLAKTVFVNDRTVRLQIWDTAGQERFHSLIPAYIRDCSAAIIVYDVTQLDGFDWVDKWVQDVYKQQGDNVVLMLVGNKVDLVQRKIKHRCVTVEDGQKKAKQYNALFYESSAQTGYNVQHIFNKLTETCLEHCLDAAGSFKGQPSHRGSNGKVSNIKLQSEAVEYRFGNAAQLEKQRTLCNCK